VLLRVPVVVVVVFAVVAVVDQQADAHSIFELIERKEGTKLTTNTGIKGANAQERRKSTSGNCGNKQMMAWAAARRAAIRAR
jgi:hypothetical protein